MGMLQKFSNVQYESPELSFVVVVVEAGFSLSDPMLEEIYGEKEEIVW